jgi:uncharacterized protein YegP (UPF0339 family)
MTLFEIYQDRQGGWRWRLRGEIGCRLAYSVNAYKTKEDAVTACEFVKRAATTAQLYVREGC